MTNQLPAPTPCRSCGAPIRWATTDKGKHIPVDAHPTLGGNIALYAHGNVLHATVITGTKLAAYATQNDVYTTHFASCPQAKGWRRK